MKLRTIILIPGKAADHFNEFELAKRKALGLQGEMNFK